MGKRKPAIMLTAGTLAMATLLSVGMTANASDIIPTSRNVTQTASAKSTATYPKGAWISVDGEWFEDFDPSDGLDDEDTGYVDSAVWNVKGGDIELHDLPAGWTVGTEMRVNRLTGEWSAFYLVEDETGTYRYYWYFDGADGITHTVDEMRGFTLTLNGEPVDCDPTGDVDVHEVYPSDYVGYEGAPANWTVVQRDFAENGVEGYEYVAYPTDTESPAITYRFWYDVPDPEDELETVTAVLDDGSPVTGFDPTDHGTVYRIPRGHTVTLGNLPAGWTQSRVENEKRVAITLNRTDGGGGIPYMFDYVDDYTWTYTVDQLQHVTAALPDGTPIDGFGWRGGRWTLPKGTTGVNLTGVPDGWGKDVGHEGDTWTVTVTSPDGSVSVDYIFDVPHTYTAGELSGITATADDTPVDGFTPTQSGTWTVPYGSTVGIKGIPDNWVTTHEDGTLTWTVTAPDNTVSVTYTFEYAAKPASKDDLKTVTATVNGQPVTGFDPVNGGTFTVPAGTTSVDLAGIPDGWSSAPLTDGRLGFTLTSKDGTLTVEYVFVPETVTHTVTFDSAGGTPVDAQTVGDGDKATQPADPTRDGWTFLGWWNGDTEYDFAQPVSGDLTLTAHWERDAPAVHTVSFDTGDSGIMIAAQQVEDGMTVMQPADPTRDGYRFDGWLLDGEPYDFATQVHRDMTLTAAWTQLHTVTFDYAHDGMTGTQTIPDGETALRPADPERDGYTFNGWLLDGQAYTFDTPVTGDITLTADWTRITHTVTFDTGDGTPVASQTVNHGEQAIDPGTPTRDGYAFTGWLLDGEPYDFTTPITGDITLVAGWEETPDPTPDTHTVTFDKDNGSAPVEVTVTDGDPVGMPADPTRDGYAFKGWTLDGQPYDFAQPVTGDITLTAVWEKLAEYTVTFDTQGGTPVPAQTVTENGTVTRPADPTRDGYTFKGWTLDGQPYDFGTPVAGNLTLTAVWEENKTPQPVTHKVTFDTNGGSAVDSQTVDDGATAVKPADPTRDGYAFNGWTLDGKPYDFATPVTGDITLEAQWERSETPAPVTHTVRFRTNGGSAIPMQTVEDGKAVGRPADPTRPGHVFAGWLLDGRPYDFDTPVTGDIILDAAWEETPAADPLSDVTAIVDDEPLDGFDPTKDGEYHVDADADVRLSGLPEGWTATRRDTETGFSFTLTDGERTVTYTFVTDGRAEEPESPDTPDTPQTPDADDGPDTPSDGQETPDADPAPGSDAGDGLASTGVSPAGPLAVMIALLGMALAVLRGRARR